MKKQAANFITICRIFGSILLLFFPVFSFSFYGLYLFCGISDMVDGTIARKTNGGSAFGAKLDSVADFVFVIVSLIKFLPAMDIPKWLWIWMAVIAVIRIGNMIFGWIFSRKVIALHTILNKLTGFLLFLLPLSLYFIELKYSAVVVSVLATVSAVQEGWLMKKGEME
jgi:CDP-diacylglycerol--glycerol-3-phosphate 3-phosphatidyltransferase